jgi:hypothetical protein
MPIQFALFPNAVLGDGSYAARIRSRGTIDRARLADRVIERGTTVSRADLLAVLETLEEEVVASLLEGYRVHVGGLVQISPRLKGRFLGPEDDYDPRRHRLDVLAKVGPRVRKDFRARATARRVPAEPAGPSITEYRDLASGTRNERITPGTIGTIRGANLRFDPSREDEGIFLLQSRPARALRIPPNAVQRNVATEIVFQVPPNLPRGKVHLELRTRLRRSKTLRQAKSPPLLVTP